jgi:hypothetical protein
MPTYDVSDLQSCTSWTGLTGIKDSQARQSGSRYFVFEYGPDEYVVTSDANEALERLNDSRIYGEWNSWLCIYAPDPEMAKQRYADARDQWEQSLE